MIRCPDCKAWISDSEPLPFEVEDGTKYYQCPHCGADVRSEELEMEEVL